MPSTSATRTRTKVPVAVLVAGVLVILAVIAAGVYLTRRPSTVLTQVTASAEAKAYLPYLPLSDVSMKATENFMKQQVVEVEGKISNKGPRTIESVSVYC